MFKFKNSINLFLNLFQKLNVKNWILTQIRKYDFSYEVTIIISLNSFILFFPFSFHHFIFILREFMILLFIHFEISFFLEKLVEYNIIYILEVRLFIFYKFLIKIWLENILMRKWHLRIYYICIFWGIWGFK